MDKNEVLELKTRRQIYYHILKHPGLHEREISRQLDIPLSTIDYHLYYLKKKEIITAVSDGHYTQYYSSGKVGEKDKKFLAALRQKVPRKIIMYLVIKQFSFHRDIFNYLGLAPSTTSFHLNKLAEMNIINRVERGRETIFSINEPEYISDLIITYKKSFLDDTVNRFADAWLDLHPRNLRKRKNDKSE
jgi:predicted transcriptional regulator